MEPQNNKRGDKLGSESPNTKNDTTKIHMWWTISVLTIVCIILISFIITRYIYEGDKVMAFISNVSAILSIVLSIFAILYTYISNAQIQQQFEKIDTAANNIASTSKDLTVTGNNIDKSFSDIMNKLDKLDQKQQDMNSKLDNKNTPIPNNFVKKDFPDNNITTK